MAYIWPVYEGSEPTRGGPWADLAASAAVSIFELKPNHLLCSEKCPRFGDETRDLTYAGYKHTVVEIDETEAREINFLPGYYHSPVRPKEAFGRLIQQAFADEFGDENVARVEYEPTTDSQGHDALKITVVITPGSAKELAKWAPLSALVRLHKRLGEMRQNRTPIIHYATESELAENAGS